MDSKNYVPACQVFLDRVKFDERSPEGPPDGSPYDADKLAAVVSDNAIKLPASYRTAYVAPLLAALPTLTKYLKHRFEEDQSDRKMSAQEALADVKSISDSLVGVVRDWGFTAYRQPLRRFEAVISNLYRSFLSAQQRVRAGLPMIQTVPPLATFAPTGDDGPFTWPADEVKGFIGVPIGVVSLPGSYRNHPLLWPALAHETGGHDVLHADPGLLEELGKTVNEAPGVPSGIASLWSNWMDETASDVYGLLNVGPAFGVSLAAFFSALDASSQEPAERRVGAMGTRLPWRDGKPYDTHPVDILRVYLAMGATSKLRGLAASKRAAWIDLLGAIAKTAAGGATTIDVIDISTNQATLVQRLPLTAMASAAKAVGAFVVTHKFAALKGHSIQDIETWDDADEAAASGVAAALAAGKSVVGLGDDAQLLAGATMAFLAKPGSYDDITTRLNAALDDSFARDPVFGIAAPHFMRIPQRAIRGRAYSFTPVPPSLPIPLGSGGSARREK